MAKHSKFTRQHLAQIGFGSQMRIRRIPGTRVRRIHSLSREARHRLLCVEFSLRYSVALAVDAFQVSRATVYRWRKRFNPHDLRSLEPRSRRPRRTRWKQWSASDEELILRLRRTHPGFGKLRLHLLAREAGVMISPSTVGRMLTSLMRRNLLPVSRRVRQVRRRQARPHAIRRPLGTPPPTVPGDLLQLDTMHLRANTGQQRRQFTAIDVVSRWAVLGIRAQATAGTARDFLTDVLAQMPFPVRAIQIDGGSEFMGAFEDACQEAGIALYVLPPRSPKLNGIVERLHGTCRREFWDYYRGSWDLPGMQTALQEWNQTYTTVRPHTSLGLLTPHQWLHQSAVSYVSS